MLALDCNTTKTTGGQRPWGSGSWQEIAQELGSQANQLNKNMFAVENQSATMKPKSSGSPGFLEGEGKNER